MCRHKRDDFDLDMLAQKLDCRIERLGGHEVAMPFATFALRGHLRDGELRDVVIDVPSDWTTLDGREDRAPELRGKRYAPSGSRMTTQAPDARTRWA